MRRVKSFKYLVIALVVLVAFNSLQLPAFAAEEAADDDNMEVQEQFRGQSPFERMWAGLFTALAQSLYEIFGFKDPLELIFDYSPMVQVRDHPSRSELYLGIYDESEGSLIAQIFVSLMKYTPLLFTIALAAVGLYLMIVSSTGSGRYYAKDILQAIIVSAVALSIMPYLLDKCFEYTYGCVEVIKNIIESKLAARGMSTPKSLIGVMLGGMLKQATDAVDANAIVAIVKGISALGYAIVIFIVFLSTGFINWQYTMRKLLIAVLILIFPVVAVASVLPQKRKALEIWIKEIVSQATLVLAHAATYGFLILMFLANNRPFTVYETLVYSLGLNTITVIVRRIFGAGGNAFFDVTGLSGLGSLWSITNYLKGKAGGSYTTHRDSGRTSPSDSASTSSSTPPPSPPPGSTGLAGTGFNPSSPGSVAGSMKNIAAGVAKESIATYQSTNANAQSATQQAPNSFSHSFSSSLGGTDKNTNEVANAYTNESQKEKSGSMSLQGKSNNVSRESSWSKITKTTGKVTGALAGGLLSGAVYGQVAPGFVVGGKVGENFAKGINNGIFTLGQHINHWQASRPSKDNSTKQTNTQPQSGTRNSEAYPRKDQNTNTANSKQMQSQVMNTVKPSQVNYSRQQQLNNVMQDLKRQHHAQGNITAYEWRS